MNMIAQFDQNDVDSAIVEFIPAQIIVSGKTATEKRLSVVATATRAASMFLLTQGGKVGKAAAENVAMEGINGIAKAARNGNYTPLAESLACITGESVFIRSRSMYEGLADVYLAKSADVEQSKNGGYSSSGKPTAKRIAVDRCLMLIQAVCDGVAAINAHHD
jgi:hypothetical protein